MRFAEDDFKAKLEGRRSNNGKCYMEKSLSTTANLIQMFYNLTVSLRK